MPFWTRSPVRCCAATSLPASARRPWRLRHRDERAPHPHGQTRILLCARKATQNHCAIGWDLIPYAPRRSDTSAKVRKLRAMTQITRLRRADIPELSQFLISSRGVPATYSLFSHEVLSWKYFDGPSD